MSNDMIFRSQADAAVAAAYEAAADVLLDRGTNVGDPIAVRKDILALTDASSAAALDRLIREAEERGAQKEREACANALWDACPLDQIVTAAYVKRAQDAIRNREKSNE